MELGIQQNTTKHTTDPNFLPYEACVCPDLSTVMPSCGAPLCIFSLSSLDFVQWYSVTASGSSEEMQVDK